MCFINRSKKKLLFVIPSLVGGGAERVIVNLINHLDRNKYEFLLIIFKNVIDLKRDLNFPIDKIVCLNKKSKWGFFKLIFKLRKIICDYKPDRVISFLRDTNIAVVLSGIFLRKKYSLFLSERSYGIYLNKVRLGYLRRWLMNLTYKKAHRIIAVSEDIGEKLKEYFNLQPEKIKVIYNPVSIKEIKYKSQKEVEHPFFKYENAQVIISAGRLTKHKRFDNLLKAFSLVIEKQATARLIILGKGILQRELELLTLKLNIDNFVSFVGYKDNPYAWISKADIFVLPSDFEGFPNVLPESMACGTPVISTDCPSGPREIITNSENGVLVPPADEKALAKAMLDLLDDEEKRKRFSAAGKKRVQDLKVEKIVNQWAELF